VSSRSETVRTDAQSAEWRRFRRALLFFVVCLAVVGGMFLVGSYH
jgi:hypothetical protein